MLVTEPGAEERTIGKKRIILLLDGTWNDVAAGDNDTNIVRFEDLIVKTLRDRSAAGAPFETMKGKIAHGHVTDDKENIVLYQRGVGTGFFDKFIGGTLGIGLHDNIRRAYKFLSYHYEKGCDLYIFGFSRGAYTARSLVGYIAASGLLTRENCTAKNEKLAWNYYRTHPADRLPGISTQLDKLSHDRQEVSVKCLGVFDTVGAMGVPFGIFRKLNLQKYGFHDVELSSITEINLHAMAVDEHRHPFQATVWRSPRFKKLNSRTEQVWFAGAHADIGGGYVSAEARRNDPELASLEDITFDWMLRRLREHCPNFPIDFDRFLPLDVSKSKRPEAEWPALEAKWSTLDHHDERKLVYKLFPFAWRAVANLPVASTRWQKAVSYDRRDTTIGESIHISLLKRINQEISINGRRQSYAPRNLMRIIKDVQHTYESPGSLSAIKIVDWNGEILEPDNPAHVEKALAAIARAIA